MFNKNIIDLFISSIEKQLTLAKNQLQADAMTFLLYDSNTDRYHLLLQKGLKDPKTFTDPDMSPCMDQVVGQVIRSQKAIPVSDISINSALNRPFAQREGFKSVGCYPIIRGNDAIGVVFVSFRTVKTLSAKQERLLCETISHLSSLIRDWV